MALPVASAGSSATATPPPLRTSPPTVISRVGSHPIGTAPPIAVALPLPCTRLGSTAGERLAMTVLLTPVSRIAVRAAPSSRSVKRIWLPGVRSNGTQRVSVSLASVTTPSFPAGALAKSSGASSTRTSGRIMAAPLAENARQT